MSSVKLPTPLAPDEVDKIIDEKFYFGIRDYEPEEFIIHWCRPYTGATNHIGLMFSLKDDEGWEEEDEDGYCEWWGRSHMDEIAMDKYYANEDMTLPGEFTGIY